MKKIYSLVCAVAISSLSYAQTQKTINPALTKPAKGFSFDRSILRSANNNNHAKAASLNQGWFNFGDAAQSFYSVTSSLNSNYLFPDSMAYGEFGTGNFAPIWVHHLAEMVNFKSPIFSSDANTSWVAANPTAPFLIDSMSIVYGYTRNHPNANIVDTLIVTVFDNTTAANLSSTSGFIGTTAANYGTDTLSFKRIGYNQSGNFIAAATATTSPQVAPVGQYVFKVLLTGADTAATLYREKAFKLPVGFTSSGSKLVVGSVMFKPGYTYTLTQQIDATANTFFFTSYEEKGDGGSGAPGTYMSYLDCNFGSSACDYSMSYILPQDVRYNMGASWNYRFVPSLAYGMSYGFEHHLISFHLTDNVLAGVKELDANSATLGQNVPNPFNGESTVSYQLTKEATSVVFTLTDVMGRVISSEKVASTVGVHSVKVASLAAGVYYYTLNVDGKTATRKMIAQ